MTFDRSITRTSRHAKFDVESLDERIVPAHLGFMAAGGHVHLNLIEKFESGNGGLQGKSFKLSEGPINTHRHTTPVIATGPVHFNSLSVPARSPVPGSNPPVHPVIVSPPIYFKALSVPGRSPLPGKNPPVQPIIVSPPIYFNAVTAPANTAATNFPGNVSPSLIAIYEQYEQNPGAFAGGDEVGIMVHDSNPNDFKGLLSELTAAGMTSPVSTNGTITGQLPISELLTVANYSTSLTIIAEPAESLK